MWVLGVSLGLLGFGVGVLGVGCRGPGDGCWGMVEVVRVRGEGEG